MIATSTRVSIHVAERILDADTVVVFIAEKAKVDGRAAELLRPGQRQAVQRLISSGAARGMARELVSDLLESGRGKFQRVYVVGLGPAERVTPDTIREAAGIVAKAARDDRCASIALLPPNLKSIGQEKAAEAVVNGFLLASFRYREYDGTVKKKKDNGEPAEQVRLTIVAAAAKAVRQAIDRGRIVADAQNFARTIASRPGNNINPVSLVDVAKSLAKEAGLNLRVLDEKQMQKLSMGGILGVGGGSKTPPRMIVLEWKGSGFRGQGSEQKRRRPRLNAKPRTLNPLLVVGKTITFDTGGISIKPAEKMQKMIYDKCGGMAVLGLMYAASKLRLPVHLVGILSAAENHVSANSYRPGDILRMHNGVTVEVTNTDAEGRLVLGDALAWGIRTFKPAAAVDIATLTGGIIIALGRTMAGLMGNNDALCDQIAGAADRAGEKLWRMPLGEEHREQLKSDLADIVNSAGREASALTAGAFLRHFVPEETPWAHLDIAGVADTDKDLPYYGKGATGWGVRTLVEWVERRAASF